MSGGGKQAMVFQFHSQGETVMKFLLVMLLALPWSSLSVADEPLEVNQTEVLRLGNLVQHVDGIRAEGNVDAFVEALGPPASDADKWFVSVLTMQGCAPCQKLKSDWATSPWLLALAHPSDPKQSWAHYNVYAHEDRSQAFRFESLQVTAYPTVIVQPPRSGKYGKASTVVFQGTYGGDPQQLATNIVQAIRHYVAKFEAAQPRQTQQGPIGVDPPWQPQPMSDPFAPNVAPVFPNARPLIPPLFDERKPLIEIPWGSIMAALTAGVSLPVIIGVVIWAIYYIRSQRQAAGKELLLDDAMLEKLVALLKQVADSASQPKARSTKRNS